ncbi:hypothetical protein AYO43_08250 [Nitrospira sp. SCGC AG-212-E16]|nr:hypothetical protein AYO43_08250 [Nitrospira sp. SCGC AG-212-E16]
MDQADIHTLNVPSLHRYHFEAEARSDEHLGRSRQRIVRESAPRRNVVTNLRIACLALVFIAFPLNASQADQVKGTATYL